MEVSPCGEDLRTANTSWIGTLSCCKPTPHEMANTVNTQDRGRQGEEIDGGRRRTDEVDVLVLEVFQ